LRLDRPSVRENDAHAGPALGGEKLRELRVFDRLDRSDETSDAGILEPFRAYFICADAPEEERCGHRKGQAVLRFLGRARHRALRAECHRFGEALNGDAFDLIRDKAMLALQSKRSLDRRLRPAARARGGPENPLSDSELHAKYRELAAPVLGSARATRVENAVAALATDAAALPSLLEDLLPAAN
jgi:hypothetical protein